MFKNTACYKIYLLVFIALASFNFSIAQDSLSQKPTSELQRLYRAYKNINPEKAKFYADQLYKNAIKNNNVKEKAKAIYNRAYIQEKLGNTEVALKLTDSSLAIARQLNNDSLLLKNTNFKGVIYSNKGNYNEALNYYSKAEIIAERLGNLNDILLMSRNIGVIRIKIGDYKSAKDVFSNNLEKIKVSSIKGFEREHALNYYNIADAHLKMGDYKQALKYADSSIGFLSHKNVSDLYVPFYSIIAIINFHQGNYKKTIEICNDLVFKINKTQNKKKLVTPYLELGRSYLKLDDCNTAIFYFEGIKKLINEHSISFPELGETYESLARCYISIGDKDKAKINIDLFSEFIKIKDATNSDINYKINKDLESRLETLDAKNRLQKRTMNYFYGLAAFLVVLFSLIYWKKQTLNNKRFKKLLLTIEELERPQGQSLDEPKTIPKDVNPENVEQILKALDKFESSELFLSTQCNLVYVAKKLKTNTSYLSKVINTHKGKPFKSYLTELRINASLIHLKNNKQLRLYTIKALAEEFGFKRYETFSRAFKTQTGIYPSVYIKNLDKEKV